MRGVVPLLLLLLLATSCSRESDAKKKARESITKTLLQTKQLTYVFKGAIPDGGSICFEFTAESGFTLEVRAQPREFWGEKSSYQVLWLSDPHSREEFALLPLSDLERTLIGLLENARIDTESKADAYSKPSRQSLLWLLSRLKDRSLAWTSVPD